MRISISGSANLGKTTLVNDFIKEWSSYKIGEFNYRKLLEEKKYPHSKSCNKEGQWAILNGMIDELQKYSSNDNVIFDRSPIDCLVYSLWACEKQSSDIDKAFIDKMIPLIKESMHFLDIIFFIPKTKLSPIEIVGDKLRETDPVYIEEIDNIFKALIFQYHNRFDKTIFFPKDDCPAIIEIFGNREERIHLIRQYLDVDGNIIGEEGDTILNPQNLNDIEELLKQQEDSNEHEKFEKQQLQMLKEFVKSTKTS
jgi:hypothetical protein